MLRETCALACSRDKRIVLISHDLAQAGSQLLLVETAVKLRAAGADVRLVTLGEDARPGNLAARNNIAVLPVAESFRQCASADLVIANTAVAAGWVNSYLKVNAAGGRSLLWWIHEIDAYSYADQMSSLGQVAMALFDSHASLRAWADVGLAFPPLTRLIHPVCRRRLRGEVNEMPVSVPGWWDSEKIRDPSPRSHPTRNTEKTRHCSGRLRNCPYR